MFNDEHVAPCNDATALQNNFGRRDVNVPTAYLLAYVMSDHAGTPYAHDTRLTLAHCLQAVCMYTVLEFFNASDPLVLKTLRHLVDEIRWAEEFFVC